MSKAKNLFFVLTTTETGADYVVKRGLHSVKECQDWITQNKLNFPRPLFFRSLKNLS